MQRREPNVQTASIATFHSIAGELFMMTIGIVIYAWSMVIINPVTIIPGSTLGIAVISSFLWDFPIGLVNLLINIPVMALGAFLLGKKLLAYTIITLVGTSVLMDLWTPPAGEAWLKNPIAISLWGGLTMGIGAGLILRAGATMGGTSVAGRLLQIKIPGLRIGDAMLFMDAFIIGGGALLVQDGMALIYSLLYTGVCMATINYILYGFPKKRRRIKNGQTNS
jgi:uncharacterized membrane-anchored protein YitT (DUF2179 family)